MDRASKGRDDLEHVMKLIWGFVPTQALAIAISMGLFEVIHNKNDASLDYLSSKLGWKKEVLEALLELLSSVGLVLNSTGLYSLTRMSEKWFVASSEQYLGDFVRRSTLLQTAYGEFIRFSSKGKPVPAMLNETLAAFGGDFESTSGFVQGMHSMTLEFAPVLGRSLDLSPYKNVLDVGAGKGTLSVALALKNPWLRFDLFDLPGVSDHARDYVYQMGVSKRCFVYESSWDNWNWNSRYDCVLLSQVMHEMRAQEAKAMIERCAMSLNSGGLVVVVNTAPIDVVDSEIGATFFLNMVVELGTQSPAVQWIKDNFKDNGVLESSRITLPGARVAWIGKKI